MKTFASQFLAIRSRRFQQRSVRLLVRFLIILAVLIAAYSIGFHYLMELEGKRYSWVTGVYWTLTVMSTLGFGDITFESDLGKVFSMFVLGTGVVFLLVILPFAFIELILEPLMRAQTAARAPRELSEEVTDHVILTHNDEITNALIYKLNQYRIPYIQLVPQLEDALRLHDMGVKVVLGDLDDPKSYRSVGIERAKLVASTASDATNSHVAFTVREVSPDVQVVATANDPASVDLLELAGCTHVLEPGRMLGQLLARRTIGGDAMSHVVGSFDDLVLGEAAAAHTPLVGKTLRETRLRETTGVSVVGVWERGSFRIASASTEIGPSAVLVLAGMREHFERYDEIFCIYNQSAAPVLIIGGGRVGAAVGHALGEREIDYRIVEQDPGRAKTDDARWVLGNAADLPVLERAGLKRAPTVLITTHDDDINIYLTIYCRKLRPDIQILGRASEERNVSTLHRAGADFVVSFASTGANAFFNFLQRSEVLLIAEGLSFFRVPVPRSLAGRSIAEATTFAGEGWSVVAVQANGSTQINPDLRMKLETGQDIVVIGSEEAEERFLQRYTSL